MALSLSASRTSSGCATPTVMVKRTRKSSFMAASPRATRTSWPITSSWLLMAGSTPAMAAAAKSSPSRILSARSVSPPVPSDSSLTVRLSSRLLRRVATASATKSPARWSSITARRPTVTPSSTSCCLSRSSPRPRVRRPRPSTPSIHVVLSCAPTSLTELHSCRSTRSATTPLPVPLLCRNMVLGPTPIATRSSSPSRSSISSTSKS